MMRFIALAALVAAPALAAKAPASVVPASALLIREMSPGLEWRWRAAPEAATQPQLLAAMRAAGLKEAGTARVVAARDAASARKAGVPFRRYETVADWSLAADTQRLLALVGETYAFTGGAHGNTGYAVRIWDKTARRSIGFDALFSDWPRARKIIEPAFCRALAAAQKERRAAVTLGGDFDKCPPLAEQPIVPWGGLSTRAPQFRVLVAPYIAGPYSEGSYLVTVSWPEGVKVMVKPAYREDLFGAAR